MGFRAASTWAVARVPLVRLGKASLVREGSTQPPRLRDRVRQAIQLRRYSRRTEEAHLGWIRRFITFHGKRHPAQMGEHEVTAFLSSLASDRRDSASTQNQALSAILFLYRQVLGMELDWLDGVVRARRAQRLPVVLTRGEVRAGSRAGSNFREPRLASTRTPAGSGSGNGRSLQLDTAWIVRPVSVGGITCTRPSCNAR